MSGRRGAPICMADARTRLHEMRSDILRRAQNLADSFDGIVEAATDVATDDEHDPEGHTIAWERQQLAALITDANSGLAEIDKAIARIDLGMYGACVGCGGQIQPERLDALPATPVCIDCARGPHRFDSDQQGPNHLF